MKKYLMYDKYDDCYREVVDIQELKKLVDECIPIKENIITKEKEYTPNANANSYLAQQILSFLKED